MNKYLKRFWKDNLILTLILLITGLCQTLVSVLVATILDALVANDVQLFLQTIAQVIGLFTIYFIFTRIQIVKISETKQKMATAIRTDITKQIEKASYNEFHTRQVGTYTSWLSNDLATIETDGFDNFYFILEGVIASMASIIALFYFHWSLVLWAIFAGALTIWLPKLLEKQMAQASLFTTQENERFLANVTEILAGFDTLFSYSLLHRITESTHLASQKLADAKNKQATVISQATILGIFGNIFGQISIITLTSFLAFRGIVAIGAFSATSNLAITIFNALGSVSNRLARIRSVRPIFEKFTSIEVLQAAPTQALPSEIKNGIRLDNLAYAYDEKQVLTGISYEFELNKKYAIVGASGSGKSTLLNILNGKLVDYEGSATFSEVELSAVAGKDLRKNILYIDQAPYLFTGSLRDNITLGENFSEEKLEEVIRKAALEDILAELPAGLDTSVGEAGRLLSGGQRQRIALARGLIRGKDIILVDEGTSSLDENSALKIEENLVADPALTVIMITHHLRDKIAERLDGVLALT